MKEMIKYGFILGLICFLSSGLLAVVHGVTEEKIILEKEKGISAALKEVMPQASEFKPHIKDEVVVYYSAYDASKNLFGFVLKAANKGYSSEIEILTGINRSLEITNIKIVSQNETPGLGSRIIEQQFIGQFSGKALESFDQVQAITGATISSGAVIHAVKDKIAELKGELIKEIHHAG